MGDLRALNYVITYQGTEALHALQQTMQPFKQNYVESLSNE